MVLLSDTPTIPMAMGVMAFVSCIRSYMMIGGRTLAIGGTSAIGVSLVFSCFTPNVSNSS